MNSLYSSFVSPSHEYRAKPFWSWNGELKAEELRRQADAFKTMGFGGYFMHSRCGLITEYLGDEWFDLTSQIADYGEKIGLEPWLYDEDRWPSGSAGGKVTEDKSLRMKSLYLYEIPFDKADKFEWTDDVLFVFAGIINDRDSKVLDEYVSINKGEDFSALYAGNDNRRLIAFKVVPDSPNSNYNGNTYIDTMSLKAVNRFLELTHEQYKEKCGDRVGRNILGVFTDEPHRGHCMDNCSTNSDGIRSSAIFYTDDIFTEFEKRYGYDITPMLPEVFYRYKGEPVSACRIDYIDLGCNLFNERFMGTVNDWCNNNGIIFTGHVLHEDMLSFQTEPNGSLMRSYVHMGNPGIDMLGSGNTCYWGAKQCQSACRQFGKRWMLSEMYGCSGWEFTLRQHKILGDWQAMFGVNVRCPHLSWYTMEGECKRDYPASISYQSPYYKEYNLVETYFARLSMMLADGKPECDVAFLEPIESVWALTHLDWSRWISPVYDDIKAFEARYQENFHRLTGAHIDFDYAEEQLMAENYHIEDGKLFIGQCGYSVFVVSGALTIRESTLRILREFLEAGGHVVFSGDLPAYVGGHHSNACAELIEKYENAVQVSFDDMPAEVKKYSHVDTDITGAPKSVFIQTRYNAETNNVTAVLLNTDKNNDSGEFVLSCGGYSDGRAEIWNTVDGTRKVFPSVYEGGKRCVKVHLMPAESMVFVFTDDTDEIETYTEEPLKSTGTLSGGEFDYTLDESNVLVLDYCKSVFNGETVSERDEVLRTDDKIRDRAHIEHRGGEMLQPWFVKKTCDEVLGKLELEYSFNCAKIPSGDVFICGERAYEQEYYINGIRLTPVSLSDYWVDNAFTKMPVPSGALRQGLNTVTIKTDFRRSTNIEAVYVTGSFGVDSMTDEITALPEKLGLDDMAKRDIPFYSGCVTVKIPYEKYSGLVSETAEHIYVKVPHFSSCLVTVDTPESHTPIAWEPYTADVTEAVKKHETISVTLVNSRRNSFGPLHINPVRHGSYGPGSFRTGGDGWNDSYSLIETEIGSIEFLAD